MRKTGSIVIAQAVAGGRGFALVIIGVALLLASAAVHANPYHVLAALLLCVSIFGMRVLSDVDETLMDQRWRSIIRFTDRASLFLLVIGTLAPLLLMIKRGQQGWDIMMLAGLLLLWRTVLDRIVVDYRKARAVLLVMAVVWLPVAAMQRSGLVVAYLVAGAGILAAAAFASVLVRSLSAVPDEYRSVDVSTETR